MNHVLTAAMYGLIAGVFGTSAGGLLACVLSNKNKRLLSFILEYSGGLMMAIVCFDLLPSAFEFASLFTVIGGIVIGVLLMILSEGLMKDNGSRKNMKTSIRSTGLAIAFGVAIHNFPEGLAVGSGFEAEMKLGISLAIAIMLHDIPEGVSIAMPLRAGGISRMRALLLTMATGLPMGVGALLGAWIGSVSPFFITICLATAGGAMLYVIFADMIPESKRMYAGRLGSLGSILGMISGIIISVQLNK